MIRTEPIIAVKNVQISSVFYQSLLGCESSHGGDAFEILTSGENTVLCLHKWGEHEHPTMLNPGIGSGNGLILFFRTDQLDELYQNAKKMGALIEQSIHYNENSLKNQFILRDPDHYYLIISEE